jgi:uncharacterized protein involved in type VI secretion and phage assembly
VAEKTLTIATAIGAQSPIGESWPLMLAMVQGSEGISMPFCYDVTLYRPEADSGGRPMPEIDATELINTAATIGIRIDDGQWIYRTGIIASVEKAGTSNVRHETQTNYFIYNARIVPAFKMLDNEVTFRVFEKMNLQQIFQEVIKDFPSITSPSYINFGQLTSDDMPQIEYCVQFGESSFNFMSRLMAQHGIWYMFEHRQTADSTANETMVLGKQVSYVQQCGNDQMSVVLYDASETEIAPFTRSYHPAHHHVWVGDFNDLIPTVPIGADTDVEQAYDLQPKEPKITSRFRLDRFPRDVLNQAGNGIQAAADQNAEAIIRSEETGVYVAKGQSKNRTFMAGRAFQIIKDDTNAAGTDKNYLISALSFTAAEYSYGHTTGWDIANLLGDLSWKMFAPSGNKTGKRVLSALNNLSAAGLSNYLQNEGPYALGHAFYRNSGVQNNGGATKPWFFPFFAGGYIAAAPLGMQALIDRVDHIIDRHDDDYGNAFLVIPWDPGKGLWRFPLPLAASPVVNGPHLAVVIGKKGTDESERGHIYNNTEGRVRIRFAWQRTVPQAGQPTAPVSPGSDTDPQASDRRTCWVRVSEAWAGRQYGSQFLPRIGDEVIVSFIDGDPNRPIITGRVYNSVAYQPFGQSGTITPARSGFKTQSTPMPANSNQQFHLLRFDDTPGKEQLLLRSQGRTDVTTLGSYFDTISGSYNLTIGGKDPPHNKIWGDDITKVFRHCDLHVGDPALGGSMHTLSENNYELTVKKDTILDLQQDLTTVVKGTVSVNAASLVLEATKKLTLKVGSNSIVITPIAIYLNGSLLNHNSGDGSPDSSVNGVLQDLMNPTAADPGTPEDWLAKQKGGGSMTVGAHAAIAKHAPPSKLNPNFEMLIDPSGPEDV